MGLMDSGAVFNLRTRDFAFAVGVALAVVALSINQLVSSQTRSRDAQRRADTELVARALVLFYKENGFFPKAQDGKIVSCGGRGADACEWGNDRMVDASGLEYLKNLPRDPYFDRGFKYVYQTDAEQINFKVFARLENTRDPVVRSNLGVWCGEGECNWLVENRR